MNNLVQVLNKDGQLVVTSRQVAKDFGKEHSKVIRSIETIKGGNSSQNWLQYFIPSGYKDISGKSNKEYLLTRDGFSLLVMGFTGTKALEWKLKYIEAFNKMEQKLKEQKQLSPLAQLRLQYQVIEQHEEKLNTIENKVRSLEDTMTIDYAQQEKLNTLAKKVVVQALGGKDTPAYKELNKKAFSALWRDYKRIMQVNSYKNTAVKEFEKAEKILNNWKPGRELELMIAGANSQMRF